MSQQLCVQEKVHKQTISSIKHNGLVFLTLPSDAAIYDVLPTVIFKWNTSDINSPDISFTFIVLLGRPGHTCVCVHNFYAMFKKNSKLLFLTKDIHAYKHDW